MAPKSPWNKNNANQKSNKHGSHVSAVSPTKGKINYTEVQDEEIEVLRAIYMDDYQDVETKVAWSTTSERAFKLRLRAFSDVDTSVVVSVKLTATYPRTLPLLNVEELDNLRPATCQNIKSLIVSRSKELLGEVMIHAISTEIQEILEDAVQTREHGALPSLEEERAVHEAALNENARKQEEDEVKRKADAKADEDRVLKQMLDQELSRRESKQRNKLTPRRVRTDANDLHFSENNTKRLAKGPITEVFVVLSSALQDSPALTAGENASLVLKRACVTPHQKQMITTLENELEALKKLRHPSVVRILDYAIEKSEAGGEPASEQWEIRILTDYANKGPLSELLDFWGPLQVEKVRSCSIELLEALDFYHRNGIVHGRIHTNNVLVSTSSGVTSFQLADAGFQDMLYDIESSPDRVAVATSKSAYWLPPETVQGQAESTRRTRKTDVWEFGVVFLQLLFGLRVTLEHSSPSTLLETLQPSEPLEDMVRNIFRPDPKKRPSAFDLIPCEFLRNSVSILDEPSPQAQRRFSLATTGQKSPHNRRSRHGSSGLLRPFSRYASDFVEMARLGKGGYGEVVKVRNKTDGGVYAIKKIKQKSASALTETLSEVMLLQRLNHPYVVRYYSAWVEDDIASILEIDEDSTTTTEENPSSALEEASSALYLSNIDFGYSTGGLDFVSSGRYPQVEFEEDEDEGIPQAGSVNDDETTSDDSRILFEKSAPKDSDERANLERTRSNSRAPRPTKTTLYIQMEYCEKLTLRDLVRKGLYDHPDEVWRLFRQIVEGLAHIHSHGIIHRDLKPDNIFIDVANNPRIGDLGLATSGQYQRADTAVSSASVEGDMTRSIGTALYVAPELRSNASGSYNDKVDMYSLGIIFFEMCYPLKTAMERDRVLKRLRDKHHELPPEFQTVDKDPQGTIITLLITHRPSERPSSAELLRSGKLPLLVEDETIRQALQGLSDSDSPYYQKMMSALFSQTPDKRVKDFAWDMSVNTVSQSSGTDDLRLKAVAKARLCSVFRLHGAEEAQRQLLFPRSSLYTDPRVVQLLDVSGNLVQLPYDLTLPHARKVAREMPAVEKTFAFGDVYHDDFNGGAPRSNGEVDFDIVSHDTLDSALKEAEILKIMDEALDQFPFLPRNSTCFHLNHWDLLELIMEFCRISVPQRPAVKEILSNLNIHRHTWQTIRADLRSPALNVSTTSLDDLARFDFRDTPDKAFDKLKSIFEGSGCLNRTHAIFGHLNTVLGYARQFGIVRKTFISPLSNYNEKFYAGGI
ncbi:eukaryotic translation initiation factor 2-alpha kinase, partial [Cryomyces antarcticus]